MLLLAAIVYGIVHSLTTIQGSTQEMKGFDPYEILGV